ncbi:unnamed protein product, partial [Laminaria digitata]
FFVWCHPGQAGGCCDCGDPDAWDSRGFCGRHGLDNRDPLQELPGGTPAWEVAGVVGVVVVEVEVVVVVV